MTVDLFGIDDLHEYLEFVDKKLTAQIPKSIQGVERLLQARGKRFRPSIVIAVAYYSGQKIDEIVITAASAVELVHIASLIHDDIMDGGSLRWGLPTISASEGLDSALLGGDYLFAKGCVLASTVSTKAGEFLAETITELCEGQAIELSDQYNAKRTKASLNAAVMGKTSSMFVASCVLGGTASGLHNSQIKILSDFGNNFGIYYQYMDDVNDFIASPGSSGKSVGNDVREGNYTLPVILSLQGPRKTLLKKLLKENNTERIYKILQDDESLQRSIDIANDYKQQALQELKKLDNTKLAGALHSFAENIY